MSRNEDQNQLAALFQETIMAHHAAFIETDGDDPEWPLWYAGYIQERLAPILGVKCTKSQLVYVLLSAEYQRQEEGTEKHWTDYYADFFLQRYRPTVAGMTGQPN